MVDLLNNKKIHEDNSLYSTKVHWIAYVFPIIAIIVAIFILFFFIMISWDNYFFENGTTHRVIRFPEFRIRNFFELAIPFIIVIYILKKIYFIIYNKMTKIFITDKSLTLETGIFSRNIDDISLNKYEGMAIHQSLLGRFLNYGILTVSTGGVTLSYQIEKPLVLREYIIRQKNAI